MRSASGRRVHRLGACAPAALGVLAVALAACGGDDAGSAGGATPAPIPIEQRGEELAEHSGCMSCHNGTIAPGWDGLFGSTVELDDGTTVVADEEYLARAISDPGAEKVAGYAIAMPENSLDDDEVAAIVAYIRSRSDAGEASES